MNVKAIFFNGLLLAASQSYASPVYQFNNQPLTTNQCAVTFTGNALDIALRNDGYFVVSQGKKNNELLFTRFGALYLDQDHYIRTSKGDYLLGINKKSSPNLSKLKISMIKMPPKASTQVKMKLNISALASQFQSSATIYDAISNAHVLDTTFTPEKPNVWSVQISVDGIKLNKGTLFFKLNGHLSKQEGFSHIQWPANYGLEEIKIDYTGSTQFASPSSIAFLKSDGYPLGVLERLDIDYHGNVILNYNTGQNRVLKNRVAVAKFTNSDDLERVTDYLYRPTEKSGAPRLHWKNSEYAIFNGYLEQEPCSHTNS